MGCQCAKAEESSSLNLDKSPPKAFVEEDHPKMNPVESKAKLDSMNASKVDASQVEDGSKIVKKKKKVVKKKEAGKT